MSIKTIGDYIFFLGLFLMQGCGTMPFDHRHGDLERTKQEKARMACEKKVGREESSEEKVVERMEKECALENFDENGERIEKEEEFQESD